MKTSFQSIGLTKLCSWFGITRQANYKNSWMEIDTAAVEKYQTAAKALECLQKKGIIKKISEIYSYYYLRNSKL